MLNCATFQAIEDLAMVEMAVIVRFIYQKRLFTMNRLVKESTYNNEFLPKSREES